MHFFEHESCGKCVPCRVGTRQLLILLEKLNTDGQANNHTSINLLFQSELMAKTSLCPLGQSPVLADQKRRSVLSQRVTAATDLITRVGQIMNDRVTIRIDGQKIRAQSGENLLEVAKQNNIPIPSLCYHRKLTPTGACRLCIIKIKGMNGLIAVLLGDRCGRHGSDGLR